MEAGDWRSEVQPESRSRIVNKIMEALKKHLPITGPEGLVELQKIATRFEEKIYNAATDQFDYLRKISLKMLTMETKSLSTNGPNSLQPSSAIGNQNPSDSGSLGMQAQVLNQGQQIHLPNQSQPRQQMLPQNPITSAGIQSSGGLPSALSSVNGLSQLQSQPQMGLQQQQNQLQRDSTLQPQGVIEQKPFQPQRAVPDTSSTTMDSTGQTGNPNSMDWQEEIYQKVKTMKELYLPELNEIRQKISLKFQQHELASQAARDQTNKFKTMDQLEKLKMMKIMLERSMAFLEVSKNNMPDSYREKLGQYEKQILCFVNMNWPKRTLQQGAPTNAST